MTFAASTAVSRSASSSRTAVSTMICAASVFAASPASTNFVFCIDARLVPNMVRSLTYATVSWMAVCAMATEPTAIASRSCGRLLPR